MEAFFQSLNVLLAPAHLLLLVSGVVLGLCVGILPGLGGIVGMTILLPVIIDQLRQLHFLRIQTSRRFIRRRLHRDKTQSQHYSNKLQKHSKFKTVRHPTHSSIIGRNQPPLKPSIPPQKNLCGPLRFSASSALK